MDIQVRADSDVDGHEYVPREVESTVSHKLSRSAHQITRLEVHFVHHNAGRTGGEDKRCTIKARVAGQHPMAVSHSVSSLDATYAGATKVAFDAAEPETSNSHDANSPEEESPGVDDLTLELAAVQIELDGQHRQVQQLREAVESFDSIGQAIRILMNRYKISAVTALRVLQE